MRSLTALLLFILSGAALAANDDIPRSEQAFLDKIQSVSRASIIDQLGEPGRAIDVFNEDTGEVVGNIWLFHYLNTNEDGDYYKTTELDLVGDQVVTVIFINNDFEDALIETPTEQPSAETF